MSAEGLANAVALGEERVNEVAEYIGNTERPLYQWVMTKKDKTPLTYQGYRLPFFATKDGGETFFSYADPSFRTYVPETSEAMRIYPANFAKSITLKGDMKRGLERNEKTFFDSYEKKMMRSAEYAKQLLNFMFHGDGTGTLAISNTALGSTGAGQTLNCFYVSGGTSAQAITKGATQLRQNETYQAINPSTEAVRGTFTVTTEGNRSCIVNLTAGTVAVSDKIVLVGSYKLVPNGLRNLANFNNRVVQNYNTANNPKLNTLYYAMGGNVVTPSAFRTAKGYVQTAANNMNASSGRLIVMTPGHQTQLVNQAFQYRTYTDPKGNQVNGVWTKYVDAEGDVHLVDADAPDEQIRILNAAAYHVGEEKPWGLYEGNSWIMFHGTYTNGSDQYFRAIGWHGNLYKDPRGIDDVVIDNVAHSGADYPAQAMA